MTDSRRRDRTSERREAETLPAPPGSSSHPPAPVPGLRRLASSFAETLAPPPADETEGPAIPPGPTVPGARRAASLLPETLVPPAPEAECVGQTSPPPSGEVQSSEVAQRAKSA